MARPRKKGLSYFPKDVDYYDDFKIMELMNEYGPLGLSIYEVILTSVYREGYYLEVEIDKLALKAMRIIGNRWVKSKDLVLEVIHFCADIGLIDKDLLLQNVITSPGIQKRYSEVTVRNKVDKTKYWLVGDFSEVETTQPVLNAPSNRVSVTKTPQSVAETPRSVANNQQRKENKSKVNESKGEYADFVRLTLSEHQSLIDEFGELDTKRCIDELSLWKKKKGSTKSINDYATIKRWVIDRVKELKAKGRYDSDDSSFNTDDVEAKSLEKYRK